ncbi:MAG: PEP-CTERM sorting domain-containing protein [Verrucomicrobiae bacterium]|nr:PEP-CTERM sorting domain-containing protein [Verrucomicrobiae bacterium]
MGGVVVAGLLTSSALGQTPFIAYNNSTTPLDSFFASQREFGDQINIGTAGWIADSFRFEYFASGLAGGETAVVRFYENNGVPVGAGGTQAPGALLFESTEFSLVNGNIPVQIVDLQPLGIALPASFTWTVVPRGVSGAEIFGLKLYDPPTVGSSLDDIWQFGVSGWELLQVDGLPTGASANFGAILTAVPEPGPVALLALGGLALLVRRRAASR